MTPRKVAVLTGASAGVGRATATALAEAGFDVALVARGQTGLDGAVKDVESNGGRAMSFGVDVADYEQLALAADTVERELGPIDVWINDAMTTIFAPLLEVEPEDFRRAIEVTFLGQVWGTRIALQRMVPRDRGNIVNVGSALAFVGIPLQSAYCSAKFACRGFFESARAELLHRGSNVHMSMVHLPAVNTPQFSWCKSVFQRHPEPVPPIYQPEIVAKKIVKSAIDGRRSRIVGTWNKMLVAMDSFMPGFGNHYAAIGAWGAQLTDPKVGHDRPFNLWEPLDKTEDHGSHGTFDDRSGGVLDPHFLRSLPKTGHNFVRALAQTSREKAEQLRAARERAEHLGAQIHR